MTDQPKRIEAAGGVVLRDGADGATEVLLVHRNRYLDWSLPKGKRDKGESGKDTALREVLEETGVRCELGRPLPATFYEVDGRPKRVKWWTMTVVDDQGGPVDVDEVDEVRWVAVTDLVPLRLRPSDVATIERALSLR